MLSKNRSQKTKEGNVVKRRIYRKRRKYQQLSPPLRSLKTNSLGYEYPEKKLSENTKQMKIIGARKLSEEDSSSS